MDALEAEGYDVLVAQDGAEALCLLDAPDHVELLLSDTEMPQVGGLAVATKALWRHSDLPVLVASGLPMEQEFQNFDLPFERLRKPFSSQKLPGAVNTLLSHGR